MFVRAVDLRVVLDLSRLLQLGVEPLSPVVIATATIPVLPVAAAAALLAMRFEQFLAALRQDDDAVTVARRWNGANQPLLAEVRMRAANSSSPFVASTKLRNVPT